MKETIAVIILAAGASSRMGRTKALLPWRGKTVLEHLVAQVEAAAISRLVVVTGSSHAEIVGRTVLAPDRLCENPDWEQGMGTSIRAGVNLLLQRFPECKGVLVLLADQPLVDAEYLEIICSQFSGAPECLVATRHGNSNGVPALFGSAYFDHLRQLPPEMGARTLLASFADRVICIDPGNKGRDMDTPEAYEALKTHNDPLIRN